MHTAVIIERKKSYFSQNPKKCIILTKTFHTSDFLLGEAKNSYQGTKKVSRNTPNLYLAILEPPDLFSGKKCLYF
jgi:hypothetical protein